jgi:hypothetical protein
MGLERRAMICELRIYCRAPGRKMIVSEAVAGDAEPQRRWRIRYGSRNGDGCATAVRRFGLFGVAVGDDAHRVRRAQ